MTPLRSIHVGVGEDQGVYCGILGELSHDALIRKANAIRLAERPPELALLPSLHTLDSKQDHHRRTIPPITATVNIWFV